MLDSDPQALFFIRPVLISIVPNVGTEDSEPGFTKNKRVEASIKLKDVTVPRSRPDSNKSTIKLRRPSESNRTATGPEPVSCESQNAEGALSGTSVAVGVGVGVASAASESSELDFPHDKPRISNKTATHDGTKPLIVNVDDVLFDIQLLRHWFAELSA
jgi:hypothetical protein